MEEGDEKRVELTRRQQHMEAGTKTASPAPIGCRWVFALKRDEKGQVVRHKARLVAKGYSQRQDVDYQETYSPVAYLNSIRAKLAKCCADGMEIKQCDVATVFLYGKLEEKIYMELPEGLRELLELAEAEGDDDVVYGRGKTEDEVEALPFDGDKPHVSGMRYPTCHLGRCCRVSRFLENPGQKHWDAGIKVVWYLLKPKDVGITYDGLLGTELVAYSDADWTGNRDDRRSESGMILMMCGAPVMWCSTFQKTVTLSSTEAEYMALSNCAEDCVWMRRLLKDIGAEQVGATVIYEDNQGAMALAKDIKPAPSTSTFATTSFVRWWRAKKSSWSTLSRRTSSLTSCLKVCRRRRYTT
ncbi:unnamed protein product [Phytophthora fragariaefolia]|uniref:Unnamed protein product n=1 Tax=Phytophthora fragariaefolia TaxID=1490495 RepID=A0A9W6U059_9STRA|nr:unnamed protein product [Phytophthora fragariaefolia]